MSAVTALLARKGSARVRQVSVPRMIAADEWIAVPAGTLLEETMPQLPKSAPVVLCLNGDFMLRATWPKVVVDGDQVEWYVDQPQDKEDFRAILTIAAVIVTIATYGSTSAYLGVYLQAAAAAYNLLVPPTSPETPQLESKQVFNASLQGNQARIDQPIWKTYGIDKFNPPFAAQPYYEFADNGDQYFYVVLCGGYGVVDILATFIGRTPIDHFQDIVVQQYLAPGEIPTTALANVVTSREVSTLELETGMYVGGYVVCAPHQRVLFVGIDIVASQGLGTGAGSPVTVEWQVEIREIDDYGAPVSPWSILASGTKSAATNTPQRWSQKVELLDPIRCEIRVVRTNLRSTDPNARDAIQWAGLRGYLNEDAPLNPNCWHYEIVMRASQQLSGQSQSDFSVIAQGKVRTWHPDTGWICELQDWENYVASRNPAWALVDVWSDDIVGEGLPDERIDLQTLYELSLKWDTRQDRFDYTFSTTLDAWAAGQMIASAGRARMFRRYGVRTLARDELATIGVNALTPRNCIGDMTMQEVLPRATDPDGVIVEFISNVTWDVLQVECPAPGVSVIERPVYQRMDGIKGITHARREGLYHAADMTRRQRTVQAKTEKQALTANFMMPVRWQPLIPGYGKSGDVAFWEPATRVMGLTEKPDFSGGDQYLTLRRDDNSLTDPVRVTPGPTAWDVVLPSVPDFELVLDDGTRERPIFILGTLSGSDELVKIASIRDGGKSPGGAQYYAIEAVVDDPLVHAADNALLPGPGDIQDPVGLPGDTGGGGIVLFPRLTTKYITDGASVSGGGTGIYFTFTNTGRLSMLKGDAGGIPVDYPGEWMLVDVEVAQAALFEIYVSCVSFPGSLDTSTDAPDTWHELGTTRSFGVADLYDRQTVPMRVQIREIASGVVQADANFYLTVNGPDLGGGGA